jgi:hypothetical protein
MAPRTTQKGESKQGLIITLVFFILATIGLGVATYYGFAEQDALAKKAAEEKRTAEGIKDERNYYKFLYMMSRSYLGHGQTLEGVETLETQKKQFDSGAMKGDKSKEDATNFLKAMEAKYKWNGNQPVETAESAYNRLNGQYVTLAKQKQDLTTALQTAKKEAAANKDELETANKDFKKQLAELTDKFNRDFDKHLQNLQQAQANITAGATTSENALKEADAKRVQLVAEVDKLKRDLDKLKGKLARREGEIAAFEQKNQRAPASMRTDWRIVSMDRRGTQPYINLGSADHVQPQLTFTVHGLGNDGRPNPEPKATLEVVRVIGPHLSQTRVTSVKDRNRDPILERDVIYNPSWDPNLKKHVAIVGLVDLSGEGRGDLFEFMRSLERQNIVVDAYQDPKDGSMKGKITYQTDSLIIGDVPDSPLAGKGAGKAVEAALAGRKHMEEEAKKYGVPSIGLPRYLESIGYRLPHSMRSERPSLYTPDRYRPDQAPRLGDDKGPPPMKPDK